MSRSFHALRLGNFKAFGDAQRAQFKPLTLIYGPNSAGKSSLLHAMAFVHEIEFGRASGRASEFDIHQTELGGAAIDLGGFRQTIYRSDLTRSMVLGIELQVSKLRSELAIARILAGYKTVELRFEISCPEPDPLGGFWGSEARYSPRDIPFVARVGVFLDGTSVLSVINEAPWGLQQLAEIDDVDLVRTVSQKMEIDVNARVFYPLLNALATDNKTPEDVTDGMIAGGVGKMLRRLVAELAVEIDGLLDFRVSMADIDGKEMLPFHVLPRAGDEFSDKYRDDRARRHVLSFFVALFSGLGAAARSELKRLEYLGPLRFLPPRFLSPSDCDRSDSHANGAYAWEELRRNDAMRSRLNKWLGSDLLKTPYVLELKRYIDVQELEDVLSHLMENLEIDPEGSSIMLGGVVVKRPPGVADPERQAKELIRELEANWLETFWSQRVDQLVLVDQRTTSKITHRDVGTGISQIVPVLVSAFGSRDKFVAIEQPEIHLHPAMQAELADVFIESIHENGNTFLLETHSEHLMLRIQRRIRDGVLSKEDVCVLYVIPGSDGSRVEELRIDEEGDFIDEWPGGFFEESFREKFARR